MHTSIHDRPNPILSTHELIAVLRQEIDTKPTKKTNVQKPMTGSCTAYVAEGPPSKIVADAVL
jgi:hypothetical protein